jgi:hypothetical protein
MKIKRKDIKKMILQELKETISPMDFSQGRDPSMPTGTPEAPPSEVSQGVADLEGLFQALSAGESGITLDLDEQDRSLLGNLLADYLGS